MWGSVTAAFTSAGVSTSMTWRAAKKARVRASSVARSASRSRDAVGRQSSAERSCGPLQLAQGLADAHRHPGGEARQPLHAILREQHDYGRTHVEPAHLRAARQLRAPDRRWARQLARARGASVA